MTEGRAFKLGPEETKAVEWVAGNYNLEEYKALGMLVRRGFESLMPRQFPGTPNNNALATMTPATATEQQLAIETGEPKKEEIAWRIEQCWSSWLEQRRRFFLHRSGRNTSREPKMTPDVRDAISRVLAEFDRDLMEPHLREEWKAKSVARAAGIGIWLDKWLTGDNPNDKVYASDPARPWKKPYGKPWRVQEYADNYFDHIERLGQ